MFARRLCGDNDSADWIANRSGPESVATLSLMFGRVSFPSYVPLRGLVIAEKSSLTKEPPRGDRDGPFTTRVPRVWGRGWEPLDHS
jgi:hypothetical protein